MIDNIIIDNIAIDNDLCREDYLMVYGEELDLEGMVIGNTD